MSETKSLTVQLVQSLEAYTDEVSKEVAEIVEEVGKESLIRLKAAAPRRTGKYRRSLKVDYTNKNGEASFVVYAKQPNNRLTHLLEGGHKTRYKTGKYGTKLRTKAEPHFAPVQNWANKTAMERIEKAVKG